MRLHRIGLCPNKALHWLSSQSIPEHPVWDAGKETKKKEAGVMAKARRLGKTEEGGRGETFLLLASLSLQHPYLPLTHLMACVGRACSLLSKLKRVVD